MANEKKSQDLTPNSSEEVTSVARQIDAIRNVKAEDDELGHELLEDVAGGNMPDHTDSSHLSSSHTDSA